MQSDLIKSVKMAIYFLLVLIFTALIYFPNPLLSGQKSQNIYYHKKKHFSFNLPNGWRRVPDHLVKEFQAEIQARWGKKPYQVDLVFNRDEAQKRYDKKRIYSIFKEGGRVRNGSAFLWLIDSDKFTRASPDFSWTSL